jgi:bifunctional DNase/RNase
MEREMLDRFTDQAKRVMVLAQEEARMLNHHEIGAEHLLLGLVREGGGVVGGALESLGLTLEAARQQVEEITGQGQQAPPGRIGFTPGAKKVLEASLSVSRSHRCGHIGTEHLLLGLIRECTGVAARVLINLGADPARVQSQVLRVLGRDREAEPLGAPAVLPHSGRPPGEPASAPAPLREHGKLPLGTSPDTGDPGQSPAGTVPMVLVGVRAEVPSNSPVVLLKEAQGHRCLLIHIGAVEATAIAIGQQGVKQYRPLIHDLLHDVLEVMGVRLLKVTITSRVEDIFYSDLSFSDHRTVSSRPSDAIALAVRTGAAILASATLLDEVGIAIPDDDLP